MLASLSSLFTRYLRIHRLFSHSNRVKFHRLFEREIEIYVRYDIQHTFSITVN